MSEFQSILVTGGAGFIGSYLVERLLREGHAVTVIDDFSTGSRENLQAVAAHPRLRVIARRVSDYPELALLLAKVDAVYHLAAAVGVELVVKSPIRTITTNLSETEVLLEAAKDRAVPVLITSTSEVYGKSQKAAFSEEDDLLIGPPHLARWSYACSKLMDEFLSMAYAREHSLPVIIARLFNTVGPRQTGQYGMVLPRFIAAARAGQPLRVYGDGLQTRCFCYVEDTVEALVRLQRTPTARGEVFNVGNDEETTIEGLAKLVIRTLGSCSAIEHVPYGEAYAPGFEDMLRRRPRIEKCARVTGFRPRRAISEVVSLTAGLG
jgi:UDP-glucose 4-epimerase